MSKYDKEHLKQTIPISKILEYYGAKKSSGSGSYHCFRHEDNKPSLVAKDDRGVATCFSPKCDLKPGSDIFEVIKLVERCNFNEAIRKAYNISGTLPNFSIDTQKKNFLSKKKKEDAHQIPELHDLQDQHISWLLKRFGENWSYVVTTFKIKATPYHLAIPIDQQFESWVFIPLNKYDKQMNPDGDHIYYRGKNRTVQLFPNWPETQKTATHIIVTEGEKDVMRAALWLYETRIPQNWAVITNTNGANSLKADTPLFNNFKPELVKTVFICYDNDSAGKHASKIAAANAAQYFSRMTQIEIYNYLPHHPPGYDLTDLLNDGINLITISEKQTRFTF